METTVLNKVRQKLVFAITEHSPLGVLVEPYVIELSEQNEFTLTYRRVNALTISDYQFAVTDEEMYLIRLAEEYTEDHIIKTFSKEQKKHQDFYKLYPPEKFKLLIRPHIERRLVQCLQMLARHNIGLYLKGRRKDHIQDRPIKIFQNPAEVTFNFLRNNDDIRYHLSIQQNNEEITLTNKRVIVLTSKPCWLYADHKVYSFREEIDSMKFIPFFTKPHITIPGQSMQKYLETFVLKSIHYYTVKATGFDIREDNPECEPVLTIDNNWEHPSLILSFCYNGKTFLSHEKSQHAVILQSNHDSYSFIKIYRNTGFEEQKKQFLESIGLVRGNGSHYHISINSNENKGQSSFHPLPYYELLNWINRNEALLKENLFTIVQPQSDIKYFTGKISLHIDVNNRQDWFDIYGTVSFGEYTIPFLKLRNHILSGRREYKLPNEEIAIIPEEWFTRYADIMRFSQNDDRKLFLKKHHFTLLKEKIPVPGLEQYNKLTGEIPVKPLKTPEGISATLRPYQIDGYSWFQHLRKQSLGGCLADDMGLGKTLQVLTLLQSIRNESPSAPVLPNIQLTLFDAQPLSRPAHTSLIVMPLSLVHNWEKEIAKFTPQLKAYKHTGINRSTTVHHFADYDIILTTYGVIRNDYEILKTFPFYYIILDESQAIKNPDSKIFNTIQELNSKHRLVLTGTPIENSLIDLWSQMSFLNPGLLGTLHFFKDHFVVPVEKHKDQNKMNKLNQLISPYLLRRTKQQVAGDLPPLTIKTYYCEMTNEQQRIYDAEKSAIRNYIIRKLEEEGKDKARFVILNGLMRLRQIANHPCMADRTMECESGKFNEVVECIDKLLCENHKVLIFSNFVKHLTVFRSYFDNRTIQYSMLTGETAENKRKIIIENFQNNPDNRIFLISIRAGGVGLNLTSADYVFILDPWWNPAVESQAINRTHRIGQVNNILAYKFITKNSIEEKIIQLQNEKQVLASSLINNKNPFLNFSEQEIINLFD